MLFYRDDDCALAAAWLPASCRLYTAGGYRPISATELYAVPIARWSVQQTECTPQQWYRQTGVHKHPKYTRRLTELREQSHKATVARNIAGKRRKAARARYAARPWDREVSIAPSKALRAKCRAAVRNTEHAYDKTVRQCASAQSKLRDAMARYDVLWGLRLRVDGGISGADKEQTDGNLPRM
jgi:hypothetical protein